MVRRIAGYRDEFYTRLLARLDSEHGRRLREEAAKRGQPFAGVRQSFNEYLAQRKAEQIRLTEIAYLFSLLGYPQLSRQYAACIRTASVRIISEIYCRTTDAWHALKEGRPGEAVVEVREAAGLLKRGIDCGAIVDPWNILGFQGQFSIFQARQNSMPDPRVPQLIAIVNELFELLGRAITGATIEGDAAARAAAETLLSQLAEWWDRYATTEVADVPHVHGRQLFDTATQVAEALALWRRGGQAAGDVAFWRSHEHVFGSPKAYAAVLESLINQRDLVASRALLMHWLSRAQEVPLESEQASFASHMLRWMLEAAGQASQPAATGLRQSASKRRAKGRRGKPRTEHADQAANEFWNSIAKCFDFLEVNADEYWHVPQLSWDSESGSLADPDDDLFAAAYEGVTFKDTAQDGRQEETIGDGWATDFPLEEIADELEDRLQFLNMLGQLWQIAAAALIRNRPAELDTDKLRDWHKQARQKAKEME
ncbi:MAG TPA: hypothetical protein EYP14_02800, partial [Planctomycetaceae bacterium]|nr:hypothetical protein [Planctomycetaceae bacterium]